MRICILGYRSNPHCGGQGVYIQNLSRELHRLGHEVDVVSGPPLPILNGGAKLIPMPSLDLYNPKALFRMPTAGELSDPVNLMEWLSVSSMGFPEPFTFGVRAFKFLKERLHRYDIVHDNQSLSYGVYAVARRIPTVATIHHPITVDRRIAIKSAFGFFRKVKEMRWYSFIGMQKRVAKHLRRIITVSKVSRTDIIREFGIPKHRFDVVPNGIDTDCFRPLPGISREPNRILVTNSADTPLKGLVYLLKAVAEIARNRDVRLFIVGEPKKNSDMKRTIADLGIQRRVFFTGRIDHDRFAEEYARSSAAVIPSLYEGFGLPAGEAMACAVPVISTTAGALPEVVGNAGMLIPPADHCALATAIESILADPDRARSMGEAGYRRVHCHFTWRRAAELTIESYRKTIDDYRRLSQNRN